MPLRQPMAFGQSFHRQLKQIRANIETLPKAQRPHFRSLADEAEQQQRGMEADCARVSGIVDNMRLREASLKSDIWAAAENIKRLFASCNE